MKLNPPPKLIAIVGGSGAGKGWLAHRLREELGDEATLFSLDDFYRDLSHLSFSEREKINFDHPDAIDWPLFEMVLGSLREGVSAQLPRYDFNTHTRLAIGNILNPQPFVFVEGLWLLWPRQIRSFFDLRLFLDCPQSLRWQRRLARDLTERGRDTESIRQQFWNVVVPMHERFVEAQRPWADAVIAQPTSAADLENLVTAVRSLRTETKSVPWQFAAAMPTRHEAPF